MNASTWLSFRRSRLLLAGPWSLLLWSAGLSAISGCRRDPPADAVVQAQSTAPAKAKGSSASAEPAKPKAPVEGIEAALSAANIPTRLVALPNEVLGPKGVEDLRVEDFAEAFGMRQRQVRKSNRDKQMLLDLHPIKYRPGTGEVTIGAEIELPVDTGSKRMGTDIGQSAMEAKTKEIWNKLGLMCDGVEIVVEAKTRPLPSRSPLAAPPPEAAKPAKKDSRAKKGDKAKPEAAQKAPEPAAVEVIGYTAKIRQKAGDWVVGNRSASLSFERDGKLASAQIRWPRFEATQTKEKFVKIRDSKLDALPERVRLVVASEQARTIKEARVVLHVADGLVQPAVEVTGSFTGEDGLAKPFGHVVDLTD